MKRRSPTERGHDKVSPSRARTRGRVLLPVRSHPRGCSAAAISAGLDLGDGQGKHRSEAGGTSVAPGAHRTIGLHCKRFLRICELPPAMNVSARRLLIGRYRVIALSGNMPLEEQVRSHPEVFALLLRSKLFGAACPRDACSRNRRAHTRCSLRAKYLVVAAKFCTRRG
jgi:hypothetical protein